MITFTFPFWLSTTHMASRICYSPNSLGFAFLPSCLNHTLLPSFHAVRLSTSTKPSNPSRIFSPCSITSRQTTTPPCRMSSIITPPSNDNSNGNGHAAAASAAAAATAVKPNYYPYRLSADQLASDWVTQTLPHLSGARDFRPSASPRFTHPPRILVLYGTLRPQGFSKLAAYECARLLEGLGMDVRVYDPSGLPVRDPELQEHPKVVELRQLVDWSEAHMWCGSELHGNLCSVLKNQIDWIPLNTGSVRPTQGKSVAVLQVNGGSQSFNAVNQLRLLARWMRMQCVVNQSSIPKAWTEFDSTGRMKPSDLRDRVVDVMEEFVKLTWVNREFADLFTDRYSERKEKEEKGRLLTQAEKEQLKKENEKKDKANE